MKVKDYMSLNVCTCGCNTSVTDVAKLMNSNHIGCIPVCDNNNELVGIVTDRDIALRCIACNKNPATTPITDIMTTAVCSCNVNDTIEKVANTMSKKQIRRIPIVDNNKVIGILTLGDLVQNNEINKECTINTVENICNCNKNQNAE